MNFPSPAGTYAEYVVAPTGQIARKPETLDHVEAAALPIVALTAWQALFDTAQLTAGQRVLIHAAAGGAGHIAVQLARWTRAHVMGTASAGNEAFLRELGVDTFINYRTTRFEEVLRDVDVVLDPFGGEIMNRSLDVLRTNGILVSLKQALSSEIAASRRIRGQYILARSNTAQLADIARAIYETCGFPDEEGAPGCGYGMDRRVSRPEDNDGDPVMAYIRPNYDTAREEAGFSWRISGCYNSALALSGVPVKDFFTEPEACIEVYKTGRPRMYEMFGSWLPPLAPATPPISYMHVNCLGAELLFVDGGEVGHTHPFDSLEPAIARLEKPVDFATAGDTPYYLDFWEKMKAAFPDEKIGFSFGVEGPITTAYELRGEGFFTDLFDEPELVKKFLRLTTDSIVDAFRFRAELDGAEFPNPHGGSMADDIASFVPAHMFAEYALPYWERYYTGITTGTRRAHVEDLKREQLRYLQDVGLSFFDPSISHRLNPPMLRDEIRVPFGWRLGSFHYRDMDEEMVRDFVFQAAADGASQVFTIIEGTLSTEEGYPKVMAFKAAGEEVDKLLREGCSRDELGTYVSERGKARFWDRFPE